MLTRAVKLAPNYAVAWNNLAVVSKRSKLMPIGFAYDAANQAIQLEPNNQAMRLTRGMIAVELENWKTAQVDFEWVLRTQPDNREIHRYLAKVYQQLGKTDKASFHQLLAGM